VHFQTVVFTLLSIQSIFLLIQRKKLGISITKPIIDQQNLEIISLNVKIVVLLFCYGKSCFP